MWKQRGTNLPPLHLCEEEHGLTPEQYKAATEYATASERGNYYIQAFIDSLKKNPKI